MQTREVQSQYSSCLHVCHEPNHCSTTMSYTYHHRYTGIQIILCGYNNIHPSSSQTAVVPKLLTCRSNPLYLFCVLSIIIIISFIFLTYFCSLSLPRAPLFLNHHFCYTGTILLQPRGTQRTTNYFKYYYLLHIHYIDSYVDTAPSCLVSLYFALYSHCPYTYSNTILYIDVRPLSKSWNSIIAINIISICNFVFLYFFCISYTYALICLYACTFPVTPTKL